MVAVRLRSAENIRRCQRIDIAALSDLVRFLDAWLGWTGSLPSSRPQQGSSRSFQDSPRRSPRAILENVPIKFEKLIEIINIKFLKNKFLDQSNIKIGEYDLDLNSRKISLKDKSLNLTERETNLIIFIKDEKNVTIKELQKMVWDYSPDLETHTVETHVYRLRKKMKETFGDENFILNTSNGYSIV